MLVFGIKGKEKEERGCRDSDNVGESPVYSLFKDVNFYVLMAKVLRQLGVKAVFTLLAKYFWRSCISGEVDCLEDAKGCFIYWSVKSIKSSHKDSPQTVEPSHHSMSTLYKPQFEITSAHQQQTIPDERIEYQIYSYALQEEEAFNRLLADKQFSKNTTKHVPFGNLLSRLMLGNKTLMVRQSKIDEFVECTLNAFISVLVTGRTTRMNGVAKEFKLVSAVESFVVVDKGGCTKSRSFLDGCFYL
ncbi:hypothetical protein HanPI659440_Chr15g0591591 [Helianthus annuus]|nr:hypothetical protein HanPI659440_Chr15g0591591 [Helianthus annuus]